MQDEITADVIVPVLLTGGAGTRLWPVSRRSYPKQFTALTGPQTLLQATALRAGGTGFAPPVVTSSADFRFIVAEQLETVGIRPQAILLEPQARNTAPAILAAALHLAAENPDAVMLVLPADHAMPDTAAFRACIAQALPAARAGRIVTFGIAPTRPETGYGYLELDAAPTDAPVPLRRFVEKPDRAAAEAMIASGHYLWNAGIFLFTARTMLAAFDAHAPDFVQPVRNALAGATRDLGFLRLDPAPWAGLPDLSIDYAVMERADNLSVVAFAGDWSDLGDWNAVWRERGADAQDGVTAGPHATAIDCVDTLLLSEAEGIEVVGLGLRNIAVVATSDAVLVADLDRAQDVRGAVAALKSKGARQAESFLRDHRPWGWFDTLVLADRFQVKRIVVRPGAALSLQSHLHRSEHWIVVSGTARVTVDDKVTLLSENQSIYVPLGAVHRLENPGKVAMVLIEVQTGAYLGEDDIIRYDDVYARN